MSSPDGKLLVTRIAWTLHAHRAGALPAWKGSTLRGALGWAFERQARTAPSPQWPGLIPGAGFTDAVFATQAAWGNQQAGSPWHLQLSDLTTAWHPGQVLQGAFLLFGLWPAWMLALWQDCFEQAIATGFGPHAPQFTVSTWDVTVQSWLPAPVHPRHLTLRTITTARLQDRGHECATLEPAAIARSVLRRWRQLHLQLTGAEPELPKPYPEMSRACDELQLLSAGLHVASAAASAASDGSGSSEKASSTSGPSDIRRWSNRQARAVTMPGLTGEITITGPTLALLAPILAQAPLLHIGKQPNFGLGMVEVTWHMNCNAVEKP